MRELSVRVEGVTQVLLHDPLIAILVRNNMRMLPIHSLEIGDITQNAAYPFTIDW